MIEYVLLNTLSQILIRPIIRSLDFNKKQQQRMLEQIESKSRLDMDSIRLGKELELNNSLKIQQYSHKCRLEEIKNQLEVWRTQQYDQKVWPLDIPPSHETLKMSVNENSFIRMNIFMVKNQPHEHFAKLYTEEIIKNNLANFFDAFYNNSSINPINNLIGSWKDGYGEPAHINALWHNLQGQPSLVINPLITKTPIKLDFKLSLWGLDSDSKPTTQIVNSWDYELDLKRLIRKHTNMYIKEGLPYDNNKGGLKNNVDIIKQEEELQKRGGSLTAMDYLLMKYQLCEEITDFVKREIGEKYSQYIVGLSGVYADIYNLMEYGLAPSTPISLDNFCKVKKLVWQYPQEMGMLYQKALANLASTNYLQDELPLLYIKVANSIKHCDINKSRELFQEGVGLWVNRKLPLTKEVPIPENTEGCVRLVSLNADSADKVLLDLSIHYLNDTEEQDAAKLLESLHLTETPPKVHDNYKKETIQSVSSVLPPKEQNDKKKETIQPALSSTDFEMIIDEYDGKIVTGIVKSGSIKKGDKLIIESPNYIIHPICKDVRRFDTESENIKPGDKVAILLDYKFNNVFMSNYLKGINFVGCKLTLKK